MKLSKVVISLLFICSAFNASAFNVIDLGNLEVEGEVRRPMINLYNNTLEQKARFKAFAKNRLQRKGDDHSKFKMIDNTKLKEFLHNEGDFLKIQKRVR
jgi:hypothetical protein